MQEKETCGCCCPADGSASCIVDDVVGCGAAADWMVMVSASGCPSTADVDGAFCRIRNFNNDKKYK